MKIQMKTEKETPKSTRKIKRASKPIEARIARSMNVQYIGKIVAYIGQRGEVIDVINENAVVMFAGGTVPISLPQDSLTVIDDNQADAGALATSNKPRFRYIANTSGGPLLIPDLKHPEEEDGIGLEMGEKIDLLQLFSPKEINRSAGLKRCVDIISANNGLPMITVLKSLDDELPAATFVKPLVEDVTKHGTSMLAPENEFDGKLDKAYEKEEERAEKMRAATSHTRRKTRQHGKGSEHRGGR